MKFRQSGKHLFPFGQEVNSNNPMVRRAMIFSDEAPAFRPLDEPYNGVVPFLQKFGEFLDRCPSPARKAANSEKELVLLRGKAICPCSFFAEAQKLSKPVAEIGKLLQAGKFGRLLLVGGFM